MPPLEERSPLQGGTPRETGFSLAVLREVFFGSPQEAATATAPATAAELAAAPPVDADRLRRLAVKLATVQRTLTLFTESLHSDGSPVSKSVVLTSLRAELLDALPRLENIRRGGRLHDAELTATVVALEAGITRALREYALWAERASELAAAAAPSARQQHQVEAGVNPDEIRLSTAPPTPVLVPDEETPRLRGKRSGGWRLSFRLRALVRPLTPTAALGARPASAYPAATEARAHAATEAADAAETTTAVRRRRPYFCALVVAGCTLVMLLEVR